MLEYIDVVAAISALENFSGYAVPLRIECDWRTARESEETAAPPFAI